MEEKPTDLASESISEQRRASGGGGSGQESGRPDGSGCVRAFHRRSVWRLRRGGRRRKSLGGHSVEARGKQAPWAPSARADHHGADRSLPPASPSAPARLPTHGGQPAASPARERVSEGCCPSLPGFSRRRACLQCLTDSSHHQFPGPQNNPFREHPPPGKGRSSLFQCMGQQWRAPGLLMH